VARWKPNARSRLEKAALELYSERGFQQVTVAEIAHRAGLTERTFFRHFADKREVLFPADGQLQELLLGELANAPPSLSALDAVEAGLEAAATLLENRRPYARKRHAVISANAELQERERIKLASLASAVADCLRRRGTSASRAILAAEMGIAVFRIAIQRWIDDAKERDLAQIMRESLNELKLVTAGK
jgi:AcrR family transcriptional regulator